MTKKKILLFTDWYAPGFKAGGPIRSCVNFVLHMQQDYDIYVFTSDRDLGSVMAYENIDVGKWIETDTGTRIYYCQPSGLTWRNIKNQLLTLKPDFIYLNSMFSKYFTIYPLLISRWNRLGNKIILSPRGMLRESALKFKAKKKYIFLNLLRKLSIHRTVSFHAVDETEAKDIKQHFGTAVMVSMISNLPTFYSDIPHPIIKKSGELSIAFVGRIHPVKNLDYLLNVLKRVRSIVQLSVVGTQEDKKYWSACEEIICSLPDNISVHYLGEMPNDRLLLTLKKQHILGLPTQGENFGHVIFEALSSGKPVLISDQTPWRNLQQAKAGWDIPLDKPDLFRQAIEEASAWDEQEYNQWSASAMRFAKNQLNIKKTVAEYNRLFS